MPQRWVAEDDYPRDLVRAHATGTVTFELDVDVDGRPVGCRVTRSSNWVRLDTIACTLMMQRARFVPARDAGGTAVPGRWSSRFNWGLPDADVALGSWARVVHYVIGADGGLQDCKIVNYGVGPKPDRDPCRDARRPWLQNLHGPGAAAVTVDYTEVHRVEGMPMPRGFVAPRGKALLFARTIGFAIGADGRVSDCRVASATGIDLRFQVYDCHPGLSYLMPARAKGLVRATYAISIMTSGLGAEQRQPPAVALAAPPPPAEAVRKLAPLESPYNWISNDDYPTAAIAQEMSGTVMFRLEVGTDGLPKRCVVTGSSGYALLDSTTCALMMQRARFMPALGPDRQPIPASWSSRMHWEIPRDDPVTRPPLKP